MSERVPVTVENFVQAETARMLTDLMADAGVVDGSWTFPSPVPAG